MMILINSNNYETCTAFICIHTHTYIFPENIIFMNIFPVLKLILLILTIDVNIKL